MVNRYQLETQDEKTKRFHYGMFGEIKLNKYSPFIEPSGRNCITGLSKKFKDNLKLNFVAVSLALLTLGVADSCIGLGNRYLNFNDLENRNGEASDAGNYANGDINYKTGVNIK
jgi:hypothetical protein